jgi:hypothetical protein
MPASQPSSGLPPRALLIGLGVAVVVLAGVLAFVLIDGGGDEPSGEEQVGATTPAAPAGSPTSGSQVDTGSAPGSAVPEAGSDPEAFQPLLDRIAACLQRNGVTVVPRREGDPDAHISAQRDYPNETNFLFFQYAAGSSTTSELADSTRADRNTVAHVDDTLVVSYTSGYDGAYRAVAEACTDEVT